MYLEKSKISILVVPYNDLDGYETNVVLKESGYSNIITFKSLDNALNHLKNTVFKYHLILIEEKIIKNNVVEILSKIESFGIKEKHGKICVTSVYVKPKHSVLLTNYDIETVLKPIYINEINNILSKQFHENIEKFCYDNFPSMKLSNEKTLFFTKLI